MKLLRWGVLLLPLILGCGKNELPPPNRGMNMVLIVIDTLRADHLGCYGYEEPLSPNLDALAARSAVFLNAYSSSSWTRSALASILTAKLPLEHGIFSERPAEILHSDFLTLPEYFTDQGYVTCLLFTNPHYEFGLKQGFGHQEYTKDGPGKLIYGKAEEWVSAQKDRPFFLMIHNNDPHDVYAYHPGFSRYPKESSFRFLQPYFPPRRIGDEVDAQYESDELIALEGEELAELVGNYDDEIRYLDHHLGQFVDFLERSGRLENTLIIVTADHGEEFLDHGSYWHGLTLYEELVKVPLIIHMPGMEPRRIEDRVGTVDLFPTLVDLQSRPEARELEPVSGRSLTPLLKGEPLTDRPVFSGTAFRDRKKYSLVAGKYKIIRYADGEVIGIYDLERDPKEQHPIENRKIEKNLVKLLNVLIQVKGLHRPLTADDLEGINIDPATLKALEELGYSSSAK